MPVTREDLDDFARFADHQLARSGADSLNQLVQAWEAQRGELQRQEMNATVADLRESHADIDAGRVAPVADTFADIRKQLGIR